MLFPDWSNLSLVKKIISNGWLRKWFRKTEVKIEKIELIVNMPSSSDSSVATKEEALASPSPDKTAKIVLTNDQKKLISKIDAVHRVCGKSDYSFEQDLKWAQYYIQEKPAKDWPYNAAIRMAQAMQDIDFFSAFVEPTDDEKKVEFEAVKKRLNYLYNILIQELRHTNKRGQIERQFKSPYLVELGKEPDLSDDDYSSIFNDFQELLIKLFNDFNVRGIDEPN